MCNKRDIPSHTEDRRNEWCPNCAKDYRKRAKFEEAERQQRLADKDYSDNQRRERRREEERRDRGESSKKGESSGHGGGSSRGGDGSHRDEQDRKGKKKET